MVVFNYSGAEINAKVVYYGPALSGKTTNLESIYEKMPSNAKGKMVSMKTRTDRTLFFDFLPLELGEISGYRTRILLYTVPGQVYYNATRKLVLKGADAVVFVADSDPAKMDENIQSLRNLEENLNEYDLTLDTIPWVIQYNKRDVPNALSVAELDAKLNLLNVPHFEATATTGQGIYETFKGIASILYNHLIERIAGNETTTPNPVAQAAAQASAQTPSPAPARAAAQEAANTTSVTAMADGPADGEDEVEGVIDAALREVDPSAPPPEPLTEARKTTSGTDGQIMDSEVGNVINFDSTSDISQPPPTKGEFITDPFQKKKKADPGKADKTRNEAPPKPPATVKAAPKATPKATPKVAPKATPKVAPNAAPKVAPKAAPKPAQTPPPPPPVASSPTAGAAADAVTITIPVVIKRSEIGTSVPIRVDLEIEIVED